MTTLFMFDPVGGFLAGDTITGRTAYAYPSSLHARTAARNPELVARNMLADEMDRATLPDGLRLDITRRDVARLALLKAGAK